MRLNILFGGPAGKGINKVASIAAELLVKRGYYVFNCRDYPSLIRGGHNFNVLSVSEEKIASHESRLDIIIAMDENTESIHKKNMKKDGIIIKTEDMKTEEDLGRGFNISFAGALMKVLGIELEALNEQLEKEFKENTENFKAAEIGYKLFKEKFRLERRNNKIKILSGSNGIAQGALNAGIDIYIAYPMTPATPVMHILAEKQLENNILVFQAENEISVANAALGAGFTGAKVMIGTSGGGYDLMTEALSLQGMSEIPLVVYLSQRPGPATGLPTYTSQGDMNIALKSSHGEFPRVVIAPGDTTECIEKTNEAFYFSEKFRTLAIVLGDKHVAESEFSFTEEAKKIIVERSIDRKAKGNYKNYLITKNGISQRSVPGLCIARATSYEHNEFGNTVEDAKTAIEMTDKRLRKIETVKKEARKFEMYKIYGKKDSKNLIISWGSTKGAIIDAIKDLDAKFLQILYLEPFPEEIKEELEKAEKVILVENSATGMLAGLVAEKTGFMINGKIGTQKKKEGANMILRYDGRPFESDILREKIEALL